MDKEKEQAVYINSELIAFQIAGILVKIMKDILMRH